MKMKSVMMLLLVIMILFSSFTIQVSAATKTVSVKVYPGNGYYRVWVNNKDILKKAGINSQEELEIANGRKQLVPGTLTITVSKSEKNDIKLEVRKGDGYISLYKRYKNVLPANWTYKDLMVANNNKTLVPGTITIKIASTDSKILSSHKMTYPNVNTNSWKNICRAAEEIDGMVIKPGKYFNWFDVVGSCTKAKGYVRAPIVGGTGYGGGVCFLATAVYQATCLYGPMEVDEHHDHSNAKSCKYAKPGQQAAIWHGKKPKNLIFHNSQKYSVKINIKILNSNTLRVDVVKV